MNEPTIRLMVYLAAGVSLAASLVALFGPTFLGGRSLNPELTREFRRLMSGTSLVAVSALVVNFVGGLHQPATGPTLISYAAAISLGLIGCSFAIVSSFRIRSRRHLENGGNSEQPRGVND
jgi:hypothetical protein